MMSKKKGIKDFEYGVDSRYESRSETVTDAKELMKARLEQMEKVSPEQVLKAKLLQLKLKMEKFLDNPEEADEVHFSEFLADYINAIYSAKKDFAKDVDITPVLLSQILNGHREPHQDFILKLMIHSEKMYKNVCRFQDGMWIRVINQEKLYQVLSDKNRWRKRLEKKVNTRQLVKRKVA